MSHQVFISYRNDLGSNFARLLYERLQRDGYSVFFDIESMQNGKFNCQIVEEIEGCNDFLLVLSKGALDRCTNENDWLRKEIEYAIICEKKIIPILGCGFSFPEFLPESISQIKYYHGVHENNEYFDAVIDRIERLLSTKCSHRMPHFDGSEFNDMISVLFDLSTSYRDALRTGNQELFNELTAKLQQSLQNLYYFCEKNRYSHKNKINVEKASRIVDQFNRFVPYYNAFSNSPDRKDKLAQENAEKAEMEFAKYVDCIVDAFPKD